MRREHPPASKGSKSHSASNSEDLESGRSGGTPVVPVSHAEFLEMYSRPA